jgi:hypothetical protein
MHSARAIARAGLLAAHGTAAAAGATAAAGLCAPAAVAAASARRFGGVLQRTAAVSSRSFVSWSAPRLSEAAAAAEESAAPEDASEERPTQSYHRRLPEWADAPNPQLISLNNLRSLPKKRVSSQ